MKIGVKKELDLQQDVLVLGFWEDEKETYHHLSSHLSKEIENSAKEKNFSRKYGESWNVKISDLGCKDAVLLGLGKKEEVTLERVRRLLGKAARAVKSLNKNSFSTNICHLVSHFDPEKLGMAAAEALLLADYSFVKYLAKEKQEKKLPLQSVSLQFSNNAGFEKGLSSGRVIAESTNLVRDLVNEPANVVDSIYLEKEAKKVAAADKKIKCKVIEEAELKRLGMNSLLGVNQGSSRPPKLILLEYNGAGEKKHYTALVGKGITFDSGGYNLKPTKSIEDMKTDMAGAATVMAAVKVASELNLKLNMVAVMPLCENMIGSHAQHPGDIVKAYNGKTIEIGNTDAEGRLILADALAYAEKHYLPEVIVDFATLTGACVVALGYYASGLIGKDSSLINDLLNAGEESGDRVWQLPFFEEYQDWMDGTISDLNNIGQKGKGYEAGSITAGVFLSKFVEKARWAHVDIAGPAYWSVTGDYFEKGATGAGLRMISYYLLGRN